MSKLHKFECALCIAIELVTATICCINALSSDDWLKITLLIVLALIIFYSAINGVFYMVKKTILDSISET